MKFEQTAIDLRKLRKEAPGTPPYVRMPNEPQGDEAEPEATACFLIAYGRNRKVGRLHRVGGCHRARTLDFLDFVYVDDEVPDEDSYTAVCGSAGCWPKGMTEKVIATVDSSSRSSSSSLSTV